MYMQMDSIMVIIGPVNEIVEIGPFTTLRDLLPGAPLARLEMCRGCGGSLTSRHPNPLLLYR